MSWIFLVAAIILEVLGTIAAKHSNGFTNLSASVTMMLCYALSFCGLTYSMQSLPMSTAYPIWTGVAILCITVMDTTLFHEPFGIMKVFSTFFVVLGLVGLVAGNHS